MADMSPVVKRIKRPLQSTEKQMIYNLFKSFQESDYNISHNEIAKTIARSTGIHVSTVYKVIGDMKSGAPPKSPKRKRNRLSINNKFDAFTKSALRNVVNKFYFENEMPTLDKILNIVKEDSDFPSMSRSTLYKALKNLGFSYNKRGRNSILVERPNTNETAEVKEKLVEGNSDIKIFPPFPEPTQDDFEEDISNEEREHYKNKFSVVERPNTNETAEVKEKPVHGNSDIIIFPPFPEPTQDDFDEDISNEEREHYKNKFSDLNFIKTMRLHCTTCDCHLGCSTHNESHMRIHPLLRTLICQTCLTFYNSGEFDKGDDGSELYCRWCGQGGQVYCCASCPHVYCAKCIKRNLGVQKIKEIEELDDWKCFKCNPNCIWDLRAICWAILRYCDLKNQITYKTQDPDLKEKYQKSCVQDSSVCCKKITKVNDKEPKNKAIDMFSKINTPVMPKLTPSIQVKKFASINIEDNRVKDKKPQKRPVSPRGQSSRAGSIKNPIPIGQKLPTITILSNTIMLSPTSVNPIKITMDKKPQGHEPVRQPRGKGSVAAYNAFNISNSSTITNDNINLSLESLTQGLDMASVAAMSSTSGGPNDDVVCTPDFPMELFCEVTEDTADDDVQCMTPVSADPLALTAPSSAPFKSQPPLLSRPVSILPDLSSGNIIQMTDNDVTVNTSTGGLKFRIDPQTLSSNKMYRLPDGRIFAINANANMPGGYSATVVVVTDNTFSKLPTKGAFAAC